jgi:pimeloyl-ACP methyl ester carboxylesterase
MQRFGDNATAALAIHGAGGGGWEWALWQRVWRAHGSILQAPDLMPAEGGLAQTRLAHYLAQMRNVATTLRRPVLIGASLGGLIALAIAADVEVSALILVDPLPPRGIEPRPAVRALPQDIVPWGSRRRFASTQRALFDADEGACLYAFRRWRDESAAVVHEAAAGIEVVAPRCPVLVIACEGDEAVPTAASLALAQRLGAEFWRCDCSHVGPLLGRSAAVVAARALAWTHTETLHTAPSQVPLETE